MAEAEDSPDRRSHPEPGARRGSGARLPGGGRGAGRVRLGGLLLRRHRAAGSGGRHRAAGGRGDESGAGSGPLPRARGLGRRLGRGGPDPGDPAVRHRPPGGGRRGSDPGRGGGPPGGEPGRRGGSPAAVVRRRLSPHAGVPCRAHSGGAPGGQHRGDPQRSAGRGGADHAPPGQREPGLRAAPRPARRRPAGTGDRLLPGHRLPRVLLRRAARPGPGRGLPLRHPAGPHAVQSHLAAGPAGVHPGQLGWAAGGPLRRVPGADAAHRGPGRRGAGLPRGRAPRAAARARRRRPCGGRGSTSASARIAPGCLAWCW